jgi:hypothetical protein
MALLLSGHAVVLPPMVNDIADALYWFQEMDSPYFAQDDCTSLASATAYLEARWGNRLSLNHFKSILIDAYENLIGT